MTLPSGNHPSPEGQAGPARHYADVLATFRNSVVAVNLDDPQSITKEVLVLCDCVRDVDLFNWYLLGRLRRPTGSSTSGYLRSYRGPSGTSWAVFGETAD
ncbi:uncharacterized protein BDCG_16604 [Blastomyces dermatitidis ER-3]|uniref:Uncharacterized protein n=3 Tax=Blastomyces TaxID=229219 RepID=A0A179UUA3_BLAGS|nr:uncharacterized protein BDBG_17293 [Blastomyces gilchristii SLH14081]XP_045280099.1 uncharacterized protein BDCG_16604 [Blastomyces dermatitidis ER-3]EQL38244.1 hypothetical protein BDFG_00612 [Blastomyces dermatitidis ATCC 26199]KMW66623.1 hypothetical protein BDDG_11619 [Blastomyces dermatitidis ATCC 18188]OAT00372.1 hypothetical protein BDCG_16604 [Blastomyces dermatitidis ER-3]OAT09982.1 hypothetical protein BDBG_17293 [Blastomyces gilchristii SLH14081]